MFKHEDSCTCAVSYLDSRLLCADLQQPVDCDTPSNLFGGNTPCGSGVWISTPGTMIFLDQWATGGCESDEHAGVRDRF